LISADKNYKDSLTLSERLFDHVGKFRQFSNNLVKKIIDELHIQKKYDNMKRGNNDKRDIVRNQALDELFLEN
jgi:hypothetical protein